MYLCFSIMCFPPAFFSYTCALSLSHWPLIRSQQTVRKSEIQAFVSFLSSSNCKLLWRVDKSMSHVIIIINIIITISSLCSLLWSGPEPCNEPAMSWSRGQSSDASLKHIEASKKRNLFHRLWLWRVTTSVHNVIIKQSWLQFEVCTAYTCRFGVVRLPRGVYEM